MHGDNSLGDGYDDEVQLFWFQYFTLYYYSALSFALVDILPRMSNQIAFSIGVYIFNLIAYSTIIGIFIETSQVLAEKGDKKQEFLDDINGVMGYIGEIPPELQGKIRQFMMKNFELKSRQE